MKRILVLLFCILLTKWNIAQMLETVSTSAVTLEPLKKAKASVFIHPGMDTSRLQFAASYKATGKDSMAIPGDLFMLIKTHARGLGANCFKLKNFVYDSINRPCLFIDAYYAPEAAMAANNSLYETNTVFIFCPEKKGSDTFSLKVNNITTTFTTETYLKYVLKEGEELKLNKGGFTGTQVRIKYKKEKPPVYLMIMGFGFGGGPVPTPGTIGISFTTGQIRELTGDYGQFLMQLLKQFN